ncbi:hypothetical protein V6N13_147926 [Hibiscus sabdariffa]
MLDDQSLVQLEHEREQNGGIAMLAEDVNMSRYGDATWYPDSDATTHITLDAESVEEVVASHTSVNTLYVSNCTVKDVEFEPNKAKPRTILALTEIQLPSRIKNIQSGNSSLSINPIGEPDKAKLRTILAPLQWDESVDNLTMMSKRSPKFFPMNPTRDI